MIKTWYNIIWTFLLTTPCSQAPLFFKGQCQSCLMTALASVPLSNQNSLASSAPNPESTRLIPSIQVLIPTTYPPSNTLAPLNLLPHDVCSQWLFHQHSSQPYSSSITSRQSSSQEVYASGVCERTMKAENAPIVAQDVQQHHFIHQHANLPQSPNPSSTSFQA